MQPVLAHLTLYLRRSAELVSEPDTGRITVILAIEADIVVEAEADFDRANQPLAKGMIELQSDVAIERTGYARNGHFADRRLAGERHFGECIGGPDQRCIADNASDLIQPRILINALGITNRDLAREQPR